MSTQHTNRQARLNRRQITAQYAEQHAIQLSGRSLEDELAMAEHKATSLEHDLADEKAETARLRAELEAQTTARTEAETEAARQQKRAEADHAYMMQAWHSFRKAQKANGKLSQVVRLALTPAQYHEYRAQID